MAPTLSVLNYIQAASLSLLSGSSKKNKKKKKKKKTIQSVSAEGSE